MVKCYSTRKRRVILGQETVVHLELNKGDELYLFTDGITDQFDKLDEKRLGTKGLIELVKGLPENPSVSDIRSGLDVFRGNNQPLDDQTLLTLTI